MTKGWFITGTDTEVGKTITACTLVRYLKHTGASVGVMKPVSAGGREDAEDLITAAGSHDDLDVVNPVALTQPLSPNLAAEREGKCIDIPLVLNTYRQLSGEYEYLIVEGAGGLLVPLKDDYAISDLAADMELPLIIVSRAALGTINHTLMTIEAARTRGLEIAGVIYNHTTPSVDEASTRESPKIVERISGVPSLGTLPHFDDIDAVEKMEETLNLSSLIGKN